MKKKSILISAIAMLAVSAIVLSTASYAWFVGNVTPSITNIEVGVVERNVVSLSGNNGANWNPVLDVKNTTQVLPANYINAWNITTPDHAANGIDAVTPFRAGTVIATPEFDEMNPTLLIPTVSGLNFLKKTVDFTDDSETYAQATLNQEVIRLDFFMRAEDACNVQLQINPANAITTEFDVTDSRNDDEQKTIVYSLRLALVWSEEVFSVTDATTAKTAVPEGALIYAPYHRDVESPIRSADPTNDPSTGYAEGDVYLNATDGVADPDTQTWTDIFKSGTTSAGVAETAAIDLFSFTNMNGSTAALGIRAVSLYIWIEGQDLDCTTQASGGFFKALVAFTGSFI